MDSVAYVNKLLRNQLIEISLKEKNRDLFIKMTSPGWERHLVCPELEKGYVFIDKQNLTTDSFLIEKYLEDNVSQIGDVEAYIRSTTITDDFREKKSTLHQLLMLSKSLNKPIFNFISKIYNDKELIDLLCFTSEKIYRNAVFYLDDNGDFICIKDKRENVSEMKLEEAVEFYRQNRERFFIEIKMAEAI